MELALFPVKHGSKQDTAWISEFVKILWSQLTLVWN